MDREDIVIILCNDIFASKLKIFVLDVGVRVEMLRIFRTVQYYVFLEHYNKYSKYLRCIRVVSVVINA